MSDAISAGPIAITPKNTQLARPAMPDFVEQEREGFDTVDAQDVLFDRLILMQEGSPSVKNGEFLKGDIVRGSTMEKLHGHGLPKVGFSIVYYFKEWVEFGDRFNTAEPTVKNRSTDRNSQLAEDARQWVIVERSNGKKERKVQDVHNFVIMLDGRPHEPVILGFMKGNWKQGACLLNLANSLGKCPIYAGRFEMFSDDMESKRGEPYQGIRTALNNENPWASEDMYKNAQELHRFLRKSFDEGKLTGGEYSGDETAQTDTQQVDVSQETDM